MLLKKKSASVIVIRPPALPFFTALKNRTVSWCLPGNLGCLFDFLIRSSQPDRSRRSREVQCVPQSWMLKKERERHCHPTARTPMKRAVLHPEGSPGSLIAKQAMNGRIQGPNYSCQAKLKSSLITSHGRRSLRGRTSQACIFLRGNRHRHRP